MSGPVRLTLNRLYVGNIPWMVGKHELKEYFSQFGRVVEAKVVFDKETGMHQRYGFVSYKTQDELDKALNQHKHQLEGNTLKVELQG